MAAVLAMWYPCVVWSDEVTEGLPEDAKLALDVLSWITQGNSKFDVPYGGEDHINSLEDIILTGAAFEALAQAGLLPAKCTLARVIDRSAIDWKKQCYVSLSGKHPDGSYNLSVVIGTLGRAIYEVRITEHGYHIKSVGMS